MKKLFTVFIYTLCISYIYAQSDTPSTGKITGQVTDDAQKFVEFANVTLHKSLDSALVKVALTDNQGFFEFDNAKEGKYFIRISQIGYQKFASPDFDLNSENSVVKLSSIKILVDSKKLNEVSVRATKPFIERQVDRTVLNVENSIVAAGSTAMEVLEKAPGITVDADGNIALKGKKGVLVMIDNKPTYLSAADLATMLRGMSANQIEKIEVITNPSARYDAAGNSGIINIKMKKDQKIGMNGSMNLSLGQGLRFKENSGLNLNYRDKKWNWFGNLTQVNRGNQNMAVISRNFRNNDVLTQTLFQHSGQKHTFTTKNIKLGTDYFVNKKTTLGVMLNVAQNGVSSSADSDIDFKTPDVKLINRVVTLTTNKDRWFNYTGNLNFKHTFDSLGKELTADVDVLRFNQHIDQNSTTDNYNSENQLAGSPYILRGDLPSVISIRSLKIDYVNPIDKTSRFETGLKLSYVTNDGNAQYFLKEANTEIIDKARTNHFIYDENINAGYLNYNKSFNKFSLQLGLRAEQTIANGNQLSTNTTFKRKYIQLFPSVFVRQQINKNNEIGYTFGRRIQRPDYQSLNPFKFFLDLYTYREGNPELQPQFSYNSEVTYTYKQQYSLTVYASSTKHIISTILIQNDATKVASQTQKNLDNLETIGFNTFLPLKPLKWWTSNLYFELYQNKYSGLFLNGRFDRSLVTYLVNSNNTFTLGKNWTAEMTGHYKSPFLFGTFNFLPQWTISTGAQKSLWNRKGSVKLNVNDIFLTQRQRINVQYQNLDMKLNRRLDTRYATIAFNYRFGNSKVASTRRRNGGADDENRRVRVQEG